MKNTYYCQEKLHKFDVERTQVYLKKKKKKEKQPQFEMRGNRPYLCDAITSANLELHWIELILWNFPRIFNRHWCLSGFLGIQKLFHDVSRRLGISQYNKGSYFSLTGALAPRAFKIL